MKEKKSTPKIKYQETLRYLPLKSREFSTFTSDFEKWLRVFGFAGSTVYYSPAYLRSFFHFLERNRITSIDSVANAHIRRYMDHLAEKTSVRTGRKLSHNYMLNHLNAIKLFSRYLQISQNQTFDSSMRYSSGLVESRRWLRQTEITRLYGKCGHGYSGSLNRVIMGIYYGLGLRRMEGVGIDLSDIQWANGIIHIRIAKYKRERFVPMSPKVQYDIREYINEFRFRCLIENGNPTEKALLVSEKGARITGKAVYARLQELARKAEIATPLPLHSLRHSIATHLLGNGLDLEKIGQFLGHKSLESTQIYAHLIHKTN